MRLLRVAVSSCPLSVAILLPLALGACDGGGPIGGSGGAPGSGGGSSGSGGVPGTGGGAGVGGVPGTGGIGTGGASTGGAPTSGGAPGTGGGAGTGGASGSGGGGSVTAEWGLVENPSAECTIGALPEFSSLTEDPKLPDPFEKMDGTIMADRSEWVCRREEILQNGYKWLYGEKPVPEEGSVSGSVSSGMITVQAQGPEGTASFSVTINMNGATAPAPAIIGYGGVGTMPVPSGIATINFGYTETQGGSGAKSGPFYNAYGTDHPAGYLAAWAWQISRIIDVIEQNPGTIDPAHIGVTGCSRAGKGAFVAGVLDNRIALTLPVESGIGGTVGVRLVHGLDSGSNTEYPYHAISYVRWFSEVALGQFTTSSEMDNTDLLPVDMHEMMALIAPRALYIIDNPSTNYNGLDRNSAYVTAKAGQMIFEALGVADHFTYVGASGSHCNPWRSEYTPMLEANINKFLKGDDSATTGDFETDLGSPPNHEDHIDWTPPALTGSL